MEMTEETPVERVPKQSDSLKEVASQLFAEDVGLHRVTTFLNRALKRRGFIFGLTRESDGELRITVYESACSEAAPEGCSGSET